MVMGKRGSCMSLSMRSLGLGLNETIWLLRRMNSQEFNILDEQFLTNLSRVRWNTSAKKECSSRKIICRSEMALLNDILESSWVA